MICTSTGCFVEISALPIIFSSRARVRRNRSLRRHFTLPLACTFSFFTPTSSPEISLSIIPQAAYSLLFCSRWCLLSCSKFPPLFVPFHAVSRRANLRRSFVARSLGFVLPACFISGVSFALPARAQQPVTSQLPATQSSNALADGQGTWDLAAFLGGGTGAGKSSNTQFLFAGGRAGLVLSPDLFRSTPLGGNFKYPVEVMPVYAVFTQNGPV